MTVIDTEDTPADGKVPIVVQFLLNGTLVQLDQTTNISCNAVGMTWSSLGYAGRVPVASPGDTYSCHHTRNGVDTMTSVVVPARPTILMPVNGATVSRSSSMTISYVADGETGMRATAGDPTSAQGGTHEPEADNGTFTDLNTSGMQAGPGTISLVREFEFPGTGTGFQSVTVKYSSGAQIDVTWM